MIKYFVIYFCNTNSYIKQQKNITKIIQKNFVL